MDIVLTYYTPFWSNAALISAACARPGYMAKREEKNKFDRFSQINLVPLIHETTRRPGYHAKKNHQMLLQRPRTTHQQASGTPGSPSKLHFTAASPNNNSDPSPRDPRCLLLTTPYAFLRGFHSSQQFIFTCYCVAPLRTCMADHCQSPQSTHERPQGPLMLTAHSGASRRCNPIIF